MAQQRFGKRKADSEDLAEKRRALNSVGSGLRNELFENTNLSGPVSTPVRQAQGASGASPYRNDTEQEHTSVGQSDSLEGSSSLGNSNSDKSEDAGAAKNPCFVSIEELEQQISEDVEADPNSMVDIFKRIMRNMHTNNRLALNMRDVLLELTRKLDSCKDRAASTTPSSAQKALVPQHVMARVIHKAAPQTGFYYDQEAYKNIILEAKASANVEEIVSYEDEVQVMKILGALRTNNINRGIKKGMHTGWPDLISPQGYLLNTRDAKAKAAQLLRDHGYRHHMSNGRPDQVFGSGNRYRLALVSAYNQFLQDPSNRVSGDVLKPEIKKEARNVKSLYANQVAYFELLLETIFSGKTLPTSEHGIDQAKRMMKEK
eukprot:jgi/Botrbrau1/12398/Bobra.0084s0020.1